MRDGMEVWNFKPAVLPPKLERTLAQADWNCRDVLVGCLRDRHQLRVCLRHRFYHMPVGRMEGNAEEVRYIAIYQSQTLFGPKSGIRYFGKVLSCEIVERKEIKQIPKDSDELYYRIQVERWQKLRRRVMSKELPFTHIRTTQFLLHHSQEIPELFLEDERQFRLYRALKKLLGRPRIRTAGFRFDEDAVVFKGGEVGTVQQGTFKPSYLLEHYADSPYAVFRHILSQLTDPK